MNVEGTLRRVRLGLIGAGIIVREAHVPALRKLADRFEIVAVCAGHRSSADALAAELGGIEVSDSPEELLARTDVEAVDIATPISLNARLAAMAAKAGRHVFLEKPIAAHIEEAPDVATLPERYPVVLFVAETNRYFSGYMAAAKLVEDGRIGKPRFLHWDNMSQISPSNLYSQTAWRQQPEHIGGYLSDGGVHAAAAIDMVAGKVAAVHAMTASFNPALLGAEDTLIVNIRFASGLPGSLIFSVGTPEAKSGPLTIYGTDGRMEIETNQITIARGDQTELVEFAGEDPFVEEFRDFYDAVVEGKPPRATPLDALADLIFVDAALRSAESGEVIRIAAG